MGVCGAVPPGTAEPCFKSIRKTRFTESLFTMLYYQAQRSPKPEGPGTDARLGVGAKARTPGWGRGPRHRCRGRGAPGMDAGGWAGL